MSDTPTWRSEYWDGERWLLTGLHPTRDAAHYHAQGVRRSLRIAKMPWQNRVRVVRVEKGTAPND